MRCLKRVSGMEKVNLIERSSELYEFIDRVSIEIHEIHTDLFISAISNSCELNDFWYCIHKWM